MVSAELWKEDAIRLSGALVSEYRDRLASNGLFQLATERSSIGETGGAGHEESDRHFAWMFGNSAGRSTYVCVDPVEALGDVSRIVRSSLLDGELLLVDVPCGSGAGALGLVCAIFEQRRASLLPSTPLRVTVLAGDFSIRAREHLRELAIRLQPVLLTQGIQLVVEDHHWDAMDIASSTDFIDRACEIAVNMDRVFLLINNFSGALGDSDLAEFFRHFLSQFGGRIRSVPNSVCWIEPNTKAAKKMLPAFVTWFGRILRRFSPPPTGMVASTTYQMVDPLTSTKYGTGVSVLKADQGGLPW